jgi:DNA helicase-2/ATP-dependent DNA helicase PcrA
MDILEVLNEKQQEAVLETEGYVRVIAGAGSGKTKMLVSRYAYLVQDYGIDPANILCVTFTNKAAAEMKRRIRAIIGSEYDTSLICTYHGFCARLLRDDAEKLFLSRDFQIIDAAQQKNILGEIFQKHELKLDYASFEMILKDIDKYKTVSYHEYVPNFCNPEKVQIRRLIDDQKAEIIEEYMQRQKAVNALDFHDLLSFALYLLESNREVRDKWQNKLNYIQVDEFQDSSKREMKLIDILSGLYKNLLIVGDPDQNIYEWRGSDVKLLVEFDQHHENTKTIFLNRNYRSTPQILQCANTLIEKNDMRLKKDLYTENSRGENVLHFHNKNDEKETEKIADLINRAVKKEGKSYSDFAVLYRSGFLSRIVEKRLVEKNIPYEIYGGVKFFQRMEVIDIISYLRLIAYDDNASLKRIINKPRRRFGRTKLAALEDLNDREAPDANHGMLEILESHLGDEPFRNSDTGGFVDFIKGMRDKCREMRITDIVNEVAFESGYESYLRSLGDEERYENLMEFKRVADEFEKSFGENISLVEFLNQLSLQSGEDNDSEKNAVKLMTIHASKGLEFPEVFVIGMSEGIFPSSKTIEERKQPGLEEERRLCYVAITRAKERLFIMDSEGFSQGGIKKLPSRFLSEIGVENYERIGKISPELEQEAKAYARKLDSETSPAMKSFNVNDIIVHHVFGKGKIIQIDYKRRSLLILFDGMVHPRSISMSYFDNHHELPRAVPKKIPEPVMQIEEDEFEDDDEDIDDAEPEESEKIVVQRVEHHQMSIEDIDDSDTDDEDDDPDWEEDEEKPASSRKISDKLKKEMEDSPNLWKDPTVPHSGWTCVDVIDFGRPSKICEMCGHQIIRYGHVMKHPSYRTLVVGCICAGKMEGNIEAAKDREREFKNKMSRRKSFNTRKWKTSAKGNQYLKISDHIVVLYQAKDKEGNNCGWQYSIDSKFCKTRYKTKELAKDAAFGALEKLLGNKRGSNNE